MYDFLSLKKSEERKQNKLKEEEEKPNQNPQKERGKKDTTIKVYWG